ncbi:response regulator [Terriglobus sp. RCC_193]|uniref:response regulator n=1 Tax=Terriglobus sp. RCC_193 TaxID=3239218 RepID=UPI003525BDE3
MTLAESTVLVVDDEPVLRMTFSALLQRMGARVLVACDGIEALQMQDSQRVDLILTDKQMPNMDGMTLLDRLRKRGILTPAIVFVNSVQPDDPKEMERLGVARTVTKPIHPQDLVHMLDEVLASIASVR